MTRYVFADQADRVVIPLIPPADVSSVFLTLRDQTGAPISGFNRTATNNTEVLSELGVQLTAGMNAKVALTETRFIDVDWKSNGSFFHTITPYIVIDWMPITTTPADIRTLLGLNEGELPNEDVDVIEAAFLTQEDLDTALSSVGSDFHTALNTGGLTGIRTNRMIALKAAIIQAPSIPNRIAQSMAAADGTSFSRISNLDLPRLMGALAEEYDTTRTLLGATDTTVIKFISLGATGVDSITGA